MQIPSTLSIWLSEQAGPLALIALFLFTLLVVLHYSSKLRVSWMRRTRAQWDEECFVDSLLPFGFDPQICRTAYRYLQEKQNVNFPIESGDYLDEDLGLALSDLDQTVVETLQLTGRRLQAGLNHRPLDTVEELIRFVQASPRAVEQAA